jgi:hypothetical protein
MSGAITLFPIPRNFVVPAIGQSFDLLGGQPGEAIALGVDSGQLQTTPSKGGGSKYFYLKDASSFSDALTFSMSTGGGGWGANYGMTADASALVHTTSLTQSIHFRGTAQTTQSMVKPDVALSADAAAILVDGPDAFVKRYGTHFVAGYVYGKSCNLSYHLNFSTLDLATKFAASYSESGSALGFSESTQASITNALTTSQSSCQFSVESSYRGFKSTSPQSMTDLAKVLAAFDEDAGDSTAIFLVICPWTYLNKINAAFGLPINEALGDLAVLTNKLIYIKQTAQDFINSNRYAGGSQWKAITDAQQPVQKELDEILEFLQTCNSKGQTVTEEDINNFAPAEPLLDQMNTALQRFCVAFSVVVDEGLFALQIAAADQLAPQSQAFQLLYANHLLKTLYNDQVKGVWFDWSAGSNNICSIPNVSLVMGFTTDPASGTLVGWCIAPDDWTSARTSASIKIQGSTNSRSLDDSSNTAKLYWPLEDKGVKLTVTICPV